MERHETISDEYVADLEAGFRANAEAVRAADTWDETQKRMITGTYPHLVAISRVKEGWSRDYIDKELGLRTSFGKISNPLQVIGGYEQPDKE